MCNPASINVLIVEDEPLIAREIAFNLQDNGFNIAGIAHSYEKAIDLIQNRDIDIALLDIAIKGTKNGIDLGEMLRSKYQIPFLFLTSYSDDDTLSDATKSGADGYIVKPFKRTDLRPAIQIALQKHSYRQKDIPTRDEINSDRLEKITKSEYAIIQKICDGKMNNRIAEELNISLNTVKKHTNNIYRKLGVNRKPKLIHYLQSMKQTF